MSGERTTLGLDVHARSVTAEAVDWSTGQVFREVLVPDPTTVLGWLARLPGPVAATTRPARPGSGWPPAAVERFAAGLGRKIQVQPVAVS
jgi:hypothetical protein